MENMVICSRCKNSIDSTQKFCKYCGQPVQQMTNQNTNINQHQNQYQNYNRNQYQSQNRSYPQPQPYSQTQSNLQQQTYAQGGYGGAGKQAQQQAYTQPQAYPQSQAYPQQQAYPQTQAHGGPQPYQQQTYGNQVPVNYANQQYTGQYPVQQPITSVPGVHQEKKKSNKKVIGIIITAVSLAVLAAVFFIFIMPNLSRSPEKTAAQLKKAILTGNEELARDCFDEATLREIPGSLLGSIDFNVGYLEAMAPGFDLQKHLDFNFDILQVYDTGLPKNQCVAVVTVSMSFKNMPQELQFLVDMAGESYRETDAVAMIKEGSKWKFSIPLTEELSDYIDRIDIPY